MTTESTTLLAILDEIRPWRERKPCVLYMEVDYCNFPATTTISAREFLNIFSLSQNDPIRSVKSGF